MAIGERRWCWFQSWRWLHDLTVKAALIGGTYVGGKISRWRLLGCWWVVAIYRGWKGLVTFFPRERAFLWLYFFFLFLLVGISHELFVFFFREGVFFLYGVLMCLGKDEEEMFLVWGIFLWLMPSLILSILLGVYNHLFIPLKIIFSHLISKISHSTIIFLISIKTFTTF